jgi:hypothetical protein
VTKKKKSTQSQPLPASVETQPAKPTNGHLTLKESKRTIVLTWGKYSVTVVCLTALGIALIQKLRF